MAGKIIDCEKGNSFLAMTDHIQRYMHFLKGQDSTTDESLKDSFNCLIGFLNFMDTSEAEVSAVLSNPSNSSGVDTTRKKITKHKVRVSQKEGLARLFVDSESVEPVNEYILFMGKINKCDSFASNEAGSLKYFWKYLLENGADWHEFSAADILNFNIYLRENSLLGEKYIKTTTNRVKSFLGYHGVRGFNSIYKRRVGRLTRKNIKSIRVKKSGDRYVLQGIAPMIGEINLYLSFLSKGDKAESTVKQYARNLTDFALFLKIKDWNLEDLAKKGWKEHYLKYASKNKRKGGNSQHSKQLVSLANSFIEFCIERSSIDVQVQNNFAVKDGIQEKTRHCNKYPEKEKQVGDFNFRREIIMNQVFLSDLPDNKAQ